MLSTCFTVWRTLVPATHGLSSDRTELYNVHGRYRDDIPAVVTVISFGRVPWMLHKCGQNLGIRRQSTVPLSIALRFAVHVTDGD
jgi:hypothetical protein